MVSKIDFNAHAEQAFYAAVGTLFGGAAALIGAKGLQKSWAGVQWIHSQGWSAPKQIADQGRRWAKEGVSMGKTVCQKIGPLLKSKESALVILSGLTTCFSFKFSPLAAQAQFPLRSKDYAIENRILAIATSVFAGTFLGLQGFRKTFQMSHAGVSAYAFFAVSASLAAVTIVDSVKPTSRTDSRRGLGSRIIHQRVELKRHFFEFFESIVVKEMQIAFYSPKSINLRYTENREYRNVDWKEAVHIGQIASLLILLTILAQLMNVYQDSVNPFNVAFTAFKKLHRVVPGSQGIYLAAPVMAAYGGIAPQAFQKQCQAGRENAPLRNLSWRFAPYMAMGLVGASLTSSLSAIFFKERIRYSHAGIIGMGGVLGTAFLMRDTRHRWL